jgi:hypothetical protein
MHAIKPIEDALKNLLEHDEILEDALGNYVYKAFDNQIESFEAGLDIYIKVITRAAQHLNISIDLNPLIQLKQEMENQTEFSESNIKSSLDCLEKCKLIIQAAPPKLIRDLSVKADSERKQILETKDNQESPHQSLDSVLKGGYLKDQIAVIGNLNLIRN